MATIKLDNKRLRQFGNGGLPYGNVSAFPYYFETNSSGVALNSDDATAVVQADVVDLGPIPGGMRLDDLSIFVLDAATASVTAKFGFKYTDGVDVTAVPQDDDYFGTGFALDAVGRLRANTGNLVTIPKDARLIMTVAGADMASVCKLHLIVSGVMGSLP